MGKDDEKDDQKMQDVKDEGIREENPEMPPDKGNSEEKPGKPDSRAILAQMTDEETAALLEKCRQADVYLDLLQRTKADYDNYQKRVDRERADVAKYAGQPLLVRLVGIVELLCRALASAPGVQVDPNFLQGIELVHKELEKLLGDFHVSPIEAQGKRFDPLYHQAVMMQALEDQPDMSVVQEFERGYMFHDRVLRPSKVVVNRKPVPKKPDPEPEPKAAADPEPPKEEGSRRKQADPGEASS